LGEDSRQHPVKKYVFISKEIRLDKTIHTSSEKNWSMTMYALL
jgi:hypothetical protein